MICDWEDGTVTVEGRIVLATSDGDMDLIHVLAEDVSDNIFNLTQVVKNEYLPLVKENILNGVDISRAFSLVTTSGSLAQHGYLSAKEAVGKRCLISSCKQFDFVSIEQVDGAQGSWLCWMQYTNIDWTDEDAVWFKVDDEGNKIILQGIIENTD